MTKAISRHILPTNRYSAPSIFAVVSAADPGTAAAMPALENSKMLRKTGTKLGRAKPINTTDAQIQAKVSLRKNDAAFWFSADTLGLANDLLVDVDTAWR